MPNFFDSELVCGVEFFRYPGPDTDELKRDLDRFAADGFNYVRVQQSWAYEEPRPEEYDFSKTREIVEYASSRGLCVILTLCLENAPAWLYLENDVYQRNAYGEPVRHTIPYPIPADGKPGPCFDNPNAINAAERFTEAFVTEFARYGAVRGWAVWQEAHSGAMCDERHGADYCWCKHTAAAFVEWLRAKYKTLDAANRALLTNYGRWEHIMPPYAFHGAKMTPLFTEYAGFLRWRIGRIAAWKRELVRRFDPEKRPVMCHTVLSMVSGRLGGCWADDLVIAREMDVFGASIYPSVTHGGWNDVTSIMYVMDSARCAAGDRPNWAAELQAGRPASLLWRGEPPEKRDIVNWGAACVARGVKGLVWWAYREETFCQEAFGFGMLDRRGEPFEWYPEICRFNRFLLANRDILISAKPQRSRVAIAVNHLDHILTYARGVEELTGSSTAGLYRALVSRGVYPDFVWTEQACEGKLGDYSAVLLPLPVSMSEAYARALGEYAANGGVLISEGYLAAHDEMSNAQLTVPGCGLDVVFGCREETLFGASNRGYAAKLTGCGDLSGLSVASVYCSQSYTLTTGESILTDGRRVFGVGNRFGKGKTYLIGTLFSQLPENEPLLERLLELAGIAFRTPGKPLIQRLSAQNGEFVTVYNPSGETVSVSLDTPEGMALRCIYGSAKPDGGSVRVVLPALSSACVVFERVQ